MVKHLAATLLALLAAAVQAATGLAVLPARGEDGPVTVFYPSSTTASPVQRGPFSFQLAVQGTPERGNGRLVVVSHGSGGSPWVHADLAQRLVAAGFVVAIPEHRGDNWRDGGDAGPASWKRRPAEVSRAIDSVAADPRFAPLLALDRVGVHGMSAGGHTALTLAGGRWSPSALMKHCEAHLDDDFPTCVGLALQLRGDWLDGTKKSVARFFIRRRLADPQWYTHTDPRVAAVVAEVPFAVDFDLASLARPAVPLGIVQSRQDAWLAPRYHSGPILQACTTCETVADLPTAGHGSLLSPQPVRVSGLAAELLRDPAGFDRALVPQTHARIVAFFSRHLLAAGTAGPALQQVALGATRPAVGLAELPRRGEDRPVTVFYPAAEAARTVQMGPFRLDVAWRGTPVRGNGRLVVLSHGTGGGALAYADMAARLVKAGFVVAVPEHRGDNWQDLGDAGPVSWKRRPGEVARAIDAVAADTRLAPLLALDRVGMFGMSAGGHTALTLAGGRWSPAALRRHCETHWAQDANACTAPRFLLDASGLSDAKKTEARQELRSLDDTQWYGHTDPRIVAIVAEVPFAADFDPASLARPAMPLGIVRLGRDAWLAPRYHANAVLRACASCQLVVDLPAGGHGSLLSPQPPVPGAAARLMRDPPGFDRSQVPLAHDRIVSFFTRHVLP